MIQPLKTFIIYARSDEFAKTQLILHLRPLINSQMITIWHDGNILPGEDWEKAIKKELNSSDLVLLLVSANSLNSDFIQSQELKTALERLKDGSARVIPIIMSPCAWRFDPVIAGLQCLPLYKNEGPKPVSDKVWQNEHEAWTNVVENLGDMVSELNIQKSETEKVQREKLQEQIRQVEEREKIEEAHRAKLEIEELNLNEAKVALAKLQQERYDLEQKTALEKSKKEQLKGEYDQRIMAEKSAFESALFTNSVEQLEKYIIDFGPTPTYLNQAQAGIARLLQSESPNPWQKNKVYFIGLSCLILGILISAIFLKGRSNDNLTNLSEAKSPNGNTKPVEKKFEDLGVKFDELQPIIFSHGDYVFSGEKYESSIALGAYSSNSDNLSISVNGSLLPVSNGVAHYQSTSTSLGPKSYQVKINVKNPLTGEIKSYDKTFGYEVGGRAIGFNLEKMNVLYIGIDNPIAISIPGVSPNDIQVEGVSNVTIKKVSEGGHYIATVSTPGEVTIKVSGNNITQNYFFRAKRIPDPVPLLGARFPSKTIGNGEFRAQGGIAAVLMHFDFDAKCEILGYSMQYISKRKGTVKLSNVGARWSEGVSNEISKASAGDIYMFEDIICKCPGDPAGRNLGGLAFLIK